MWTFSCNIWWCFSRNNYIIINNQSILISIHINIILTFLCFPNTIIPMKNPTFRCTHRSRMTNSTRIIYNRIRSNLIIIIIVIINLLWLSKSITRLNMFILNKIIIYTYLSAANIFWQLWQRFGRINDVFGWVVCD
jgi:hypothetical protein